MRDCGDCGQTKPLTEFSRAGKGKRHSECRECVNNYNKLYHQKNKSAILERKKRDRTENPEKMAKRNCKYRKKLRATNENFRIGERIRRAFQELFLGKRKESKYLPLLGCDVKEWRSHIEDRFHDGMTWENYGFRGWHVDHILPRSNFDQTSLSDQKICWHYTNTQPLWAKDNFAKGADKVGRPPSS